MTVILCIKREMKLMSICFENLCWWGWFHVECESKITVANNDLSNRNFLFSRDYGSYPSLENLQEVLVSSNSYSVSSNLDLQCLEQVNLSEREDLLIGKNWFAIHLLLCFLYSVLRHVSFQRWIFVSRGALFQFLTKMCNVIQHITCS